MKKVDRRHPNAEAARKRVAEIIDNEPAERLADAIRKQASLRGMVAGYIAESRFESDVLAKIAGIREIGSPDDHDRAVNKGDRVFLFQGKRFRVQVKSIQTNSIGWDLSRNRLVAVVQNDASDRRSVKLSQTGREIETTCYVVGEYDILAVPLYPFTGTWTFAFKRNDQCRRTTSGKYRPEDQTYLLSTTEPITFPIDGDWSERLEDMLMGWQ